jgi:hypothetical protein
VGCGSRWLHLHRDLHSHLRESEKGEMMPQHVSFARPEIRRWLARQTPRKEIGRGDKLVFITALVLLFLLATGAL